MPFCFPNKCTNKITFSKNFITNFFYVFNFIIITTDKNHTIISKQVPRQFQARIHHAQPVGMEAAVAIRIGHKAVARLVLLVGAGKVFLGCFGKVIIVDEVIARVVGRVDVDHLDLAEVGLLQELEGVEVVAFENRFCVVSKSTLSSRQGRRALAMGALAASMASRLPGQSRW